jgi:hypothetical protein
VRVRNARASTPIAQESSVHSVDLPAMITREAPASRSAVAAASPHSAYVGSAPARQTTGCPS